MSIMRPLRRTYLLFALVLPSMLTAQSTSPAPDGADGPDKAMMEPVTALVKYMQHVDGALLPPVFANDGLVIIEDFPPYLFKGKDAAARWDGRFRQHAGRLKDLHCEFGTVHDFDRKGDRVFFVLPTTWRGVYMGARRFEEHGTWSFVLEKSSGQWRIIAYGWGVTDRTDWPVQAP